MAIAERGDTDKRYQKTKKRTYGFMLYVANKICSHADSFSIHTDSCQGPVVQSWVTANPGLIF